MAVSLEVALGALRLRNPFLLAAGPPSAHARSIAHAFDSGWAGAVTKTIRLDASGAAPLPSRYARLRAGNGDVIGMHSFEEISDRPLDAWLEDLRQLRREYPDRPVVASIAEDLDRTRWEELVRRVQDAGAAAVEVNLWWPHRLPERRMGDSVSHNPELVFEVVSWVKACARVPVWAKVNPNVSDVTAAARAALDAGADGLTAVSGVLGVAVDLDSLELVPSDSEHASSATISGGLIRPIALRAVMNIARACPGAAISGAGGVEASGDALQFMLLGARTVQSCTAVMQRGFEIVEELESGVRKFLVDRKLERVSDVVGMSLRRADGPPGAWAGRPSRNPVAAVTPL